MLDLLRSEEKSSLLPQFEQRLVGTLRSYVAPFARDRMLAKFQDADDLYNIALLKLNEAIRDFRYESDLEEVHNERRFLAMLKKYVSNALIDQQYGANVDKRKPKGATVVNASQLVNEQDEEGTGGVDFEDTTGASPEGAASFNEVVELIRSDLNDNECRVLALLVQGYPAEKIASKLGENVSRVRYVIYEKIQPSARRYV